MFSKFKAISNILSSMMKHTYAEFTEKDGKIEWLDIAIPILIDAAAELLDELVKGEELTPVQVSAVRTAYFAAKENYVHIVDDPDNSYSDELLDAFIEKCEDTAKEGEFELPVF